MDRLNVYSLKCGFTIITKWYKIRIDTNYHHLTQIREKEIKKMRKAIINYNRNWKSIDCRATCTETERKQCPHFDCMRRHLRSEGGLDACPYIKNGTIIINTEYSTYIDQS